MGSRLGLSQRAAAPQLRAPHAPAQLPAMPRTTAIVPGAPRWPSAIDSETAAHPPRWCLSAASRAASRLPQVPARTVSSGGSAGVSETERGRQSPSKIPKMFTASGAELQGSGLTGSYQRVRQALPAATPPGPVKVEALVPPAPAPLPAFVPTAGFSRDPLPARLPSLSPRPPLRPSVPLGSV